MSQAVISSPLGNLRLEEVEGKITRIDFSEENLQETTSAALKNAAMELTEYFSGQRNEFSFEFEPSGTEFQRKVWQELTRIPFGETISYQELANRLGDPLCIRAAASANGKNPIAIVIPCHRVIGSDGSMTGYAGGLERKKMLLRLEGAEVMNQISLFK